jgi:hypothetical protein
MSRARQLKSKYKRTVQDRKAQVVQVICEKCGGRYDQEDAKTIRPVKFLEGTEEIGAQCPHCDHWMHDCFMTEELHKLEHRVGELEEAWHREGTCETWWRYKALQNRFSTTFQAVNDELRAQAGALTARDMVERGPDDGCEANNG